MDYLPRQILEHPLRRFPQLPDPPGVRLGGGEMQVRHFGDGVADRFIEGA